MNDLPAEVMLNVAGYWTVEPTRSGPLIVLSLVNRKWNVVARDRQLWLRLLKTYYPDVTPVDHPFDFYVQILKNRVYVVTTEIGPFLRGMQSSTRCFTTLGSTLDHLAIVLLFDLHNIPHLSLVRDFLTAHRQYDPPIVSALVIVHPSVEKLKCHPLGSQLFEDFRNHIHKSLFDSVSRCGDWTLAAPMVKLKIIRQRVLQGVPELIQ